MQTINTTWLVVVILMVLPAAVHGQQDDGGAAADPAVVEARALLQAGRKEIIADEIRFTREEGPAFWAA